MLWKVGALILALLLAVGAGAAWMFQRDIGEAMFRQAVGESVGRDRSKELADGLHVFVCGSGSPIPDPDRAGPCLGVVAGEHAFVIDVGSGGARRLARMGFPVGKLERIYLTHLHSDHIDGLGELLLQAWIAGSRASPLPVAGPQGTAEVVAGFNQAYRIDSGYRTAHHGPAVANPSGFGGVAEEIATPEAGAHARVLVNEGDLKITVIEVNHAPVKPAFGYRIDYKDRSATFSGDTAYSPDLVAAAKGTDLLVHEALAPKMVKLMQDAAASRDATALAKVFHDIPDYHASPEDAARAAQKAGARALVLYHLVPPLPSSVLNAAFLGDAGKAYSGPIRIAEDGLLISLPAGTSTIDQQVIQ